MLADRMSLANIIKNFTDQQVYIETKYDGERIQCHIHENEVKFFTRNAIDYTYLYGPKLKDIIVRNVNSKSAILDGEIVVWDKNKNKFAPFGENKTIANSNDPHVDKQLCYKVFDLLYLVNQRNQDYDLTKAILSDRKILLNRIVNQVDKTFEIEQGKITSNIDDMLTAFNEAVNNSEEGVIIKKSDSIYKPDERSSDWVKIKAEYIDNLTDTLDLIILGGYYGEGKRRLQGINPDWNDHINSFLVGVSKKIDKDNPKNSLILPLVKVGGGFSFDELNIIRMRLKNYWVKYEIKNPPKLFGNWTPAFAERPDVYIDDPSKSIILELKAAEIVNFYIIILLF